MKELSPMSPQELADAMTVLGFKGTYRSDKGSGALARWRGCSPVTVSAYLSGRAPIPSDLSRLLRLMVRAQFSPAEVDKLGPISLPHTETKTKSR